MPKLSESRIRRFCGMGQRRMHAGSTRPAHRPYARMRKTDRNRRRVPGSACVCPPSAGETDNRPNGLWSACGPLRAGRPRSQVGRAPAHLKKWRRLEVSAGSMVPGSCVDPGWHARRGFRPRSRSEPPRGASVAGRLFGVESNPARALHQFALRVRQVPMRTPLPTTQRPATTRSRTWREVARVSRTSTSSCSGVRKSSVIAA